MTSKLDDATRLDEAMRRADMAAQMADLNSPRRGIEKSTEVRQVILASLAADGYELVPREATPEMLEAVPTSKPGTKASDMLRAAVMDIAAENWRTMLAAAPKIGGGA